MKAQLITASVALAAIFTAAIDASAASCVRKNGRSGYSISRDCVYAGNEEAEPRVTNIYIGTQPPAGDFAYGPPNQIAPGIYTNQAQPMHSPGQGYGNQPNYPVPQNYGGAANGYNPAFNPVARGYSQPLPSLCTPTNFGNLNYPAVVANGSINAAYGQMAQGQLGYRTQTAPLILSPQALAQAVPVYLIQNSSYGQMLPQGVGGGLSSPSPAYAPVAVASAKPPAYASAPAPAPAPVYAPAPAPAPAPLASAPQEGTSPSRLQGIVSNESDVSLLPDITLEEELEGGDEVF